MAPFLDIKSSRLRPPAHAAPNPLMACIWEIIDALQGSDSSSLGDLAHGHCMPISQEVDLISEARQGVALDQGNDHLHHCNMATIPLVIDSVP